MHRWTMWIAAVLLGVVVTGGAGGCYLPHFLVWLTKPEKETRSVKAEYPLEAEKLAIVCYAGADVLFTYPTAPLEISRDLVGELVPNLKSKVKSIIHPVEVIRWQESRLDWTNMPPAEIANAFEADTMLYIEIEEYSTIEERSANLFRGHLRANVQIIKPGAAVNPVYHTTIETFFPEDRPVGVLETSERTIRAGTSLFFARAAARKFYDHELVVKAGAK